MSSTESAAIATHLASYIDPHSGLSLSASGALQSTAVESDVISLRLGLPYPVATLAESLREGIVAHLALMAAAHRIEIEIVQQIPRSQSRAGAALAEVKNVIAVASGKGGVGKSATALNVALSLSAEGARVGLLDADIYGPSQPMMLGLPSTHRPEVREQKYFVPVEAHGLQTMSMGYLATEKTPMVWRGPMASGALTQMINQTLWQNLDYLIVDMPPGTGDIQLTLAQQVPVSGAVIVTTPQDLALLDAKKAIEMFGKVEIPCLGIVENMASYRCSQCGHDEPIFGCGGGERIAEDYAVPLLGELPLDMAIRRGFDAGQSIVVADPQSEISAEYRRIARQLALRLAVAALQSPSEGPEIVVSNE